MELAQESFAGRIATIHMPPLSQHEIYGNGKAEPFAIDMEKLKARAKTNAPADLNGIYTRIWNGLLPGHVSDKYTDRDLFYSSYIQTYIERDVKYIAISKILCFLVISFAFEMRYNHNTIIKKTHQMCFLII